MVSTLSFQTGVLSGADGDVIWLSVKMKSLHSGGVCAQQGLLALRWGGLDPKTPVFPFTAAESLSDVKHRLTVN